MRYAIHIWTMLALKYLGYTQTFTWHWTTKRGHFFFPFFIDHSVKKFKKSAETLSQKKNNNWGQLKSRSKLHFPGSSVVKNCLAMQKIQDGQIWSLGREDPLEKEMATSPVFSPGTSHGERSLAGYSAWDRKKLDICNQQNKIFWILH